MDAGQLPRLRAMNCKKQYSETIAKQYLQIDILQGRNMGKLTPWPLLLKKIW
jgi:hypothetical protein